MALTGRAPRRSSVLPALALTLVAAVVAAADAKAQAVAVPLKVEIVPTAVTPSPGRSTPALLIVRNGDEDASNVSVSWIQAGQANVVVQEGEPSLTMATLGKRAERAWELDVSTPADAAPGNVFFRVDYTAGATRRVATATLEVKSAVPTKLDEIATVEVKTTLESVDREHPGVVYLLVSNKLSTPVIVQSVAASGPESVTLTGPTNPITIRGRQTRQLEVGVAAPDRVRPGKYLLLFDVHLGWGKAPDVQEAHVVTTHQAQIGVFESEILTALGVPSFLLIPGFLILIAMVIPWRFGLRPRGAAATLPLELKGAEFWVIAITLSMVMAYAYPRAGGVDYLRGAYGLADVVAIWVASLLIGLLAYVALVAFLAIRYRRRTPSERDEGAAIVAKLARRRLGLERPRFVLGAAPATRTGFLLQARKDEKSNWLSPRILVRVKRNVPDGEELIQRLQNENDPRRIAELMKQRRADLEIKWDASGGLERPYEAAADELTNEQPPERILRAS